jgi:membrane associated rhomboid family serine protease
MVPSVLLGQANLPRQLQIVPAWVTVFTSMFLHGGWLHIGGNMLYLWIFGKGVETALGPGRYLMLYLICGAIAALTQAFVDPTSEVPMIGASGAIAGVLGAYLLLFPRSNVVVFFWIIIIFRLITVPAVLLLGLWFLLQLFSAASASPGEPGVAFWAHVGGFIAGMALVMILCRGQVRLFQPSRTSSFQISRARFGRGSVPIVGRRPRQNPWDI